MSTLGLPVEHDFGDCSADAYMEADYYVELVHVQPFVDTERQAKMFLHNLSEARESWRRAQFDHDYEGMDSAAAEMRDLTLLASIAIDHIRMHRDPEFSTASLTYGSTDLRKRGTKNVERW